MKASQFFRIKCSILVCCLALASTLASGQSARGSETLLRALENAWNQAQLRHDSKALDGLIADTFISTDNEGGVMNKAQFLEDNKDPSYAASLMTNQDEKVFLYENAGVVVGTYHAKGINQGKAFDHFGRFTDTWVYVNGRWLCVASHTSPLKKAPGH